MSIKHILVHVDDSKHASKRLDAAIALAARHDAHLTGLYIIAPPFVPTYMAGHVGASFYEDQRQLAERAAEAAGGDFEKAAAQAGLSREWMTGDGVAAETLALMGRYADLIVVGQPDPDEFNAGDPARDVAGTLIVEAGRPVLVIPYAGKAATIGDNVLVMWNASRESARALNDALPILTKARKVTVTSANSGHGQPDLGDLPGADIAHQLARHGVKAETSPTYGDDIDIGDLILSRAADQSADLIVMGGYGHSRFREMILGGATRHILHHMTVPVLFSH